MSDLICNACQVSIASDAERALHYKGEWHRYNVKRRCAGLTSIPHALFESQLAALHSKKAAESAQKDSQRCRACSKAFATSSAYQAHLATNKHKKRVEKVGEGGKDDEAMEDGALGVPAAASASASAGGAKGGVSESKHDSDDAEAMSEGEESEEEGEAIPLSHCLFCPKECSSVASCCAHMLKSHGFFIPFVENLVDLEGMLSYLGEKVGIGHVCLWCNGKGKARYPSTRAVQMHMKAKSHCKLRLEEEEDEEELLDYYDFDLEEGEDDEEAEGEKAGDAAPAAAAASGDASAPSASPSAAAPSTALVSVPRDEAPRRAGGGGASSINDAGELVLADGSIVGSRVHKRIYKQHVRPSQAVGEIAQDYKRLALTTDVRENPRIYRRKREAFHLRARKREDLAKGLHGNFQFHFRAQVSY